MPDDDDAHAAHIHRPLLRVTVTVCPSDAASLLVDVDVGEPLDGWTADDVAAGIIGALDARLAASLDVTWRRVRAARN